MKCPTIKLIRKSPESKYKIISTYIYKKDFLGYKMKLWKFWFNNYSLRLIYSDNLKFPLKTV